MKTTLSQSFILNKLSISVKPAFNDAGKVVFEANPDQKPYIVFDDHYNISPSLHPTARYGSGVCHKRRLPKHRLPKHF